MNFFVCRPERANGALSLAMAGQRVKLTELQARALTGPLQSEVVLGVRPEHIRVQGTASDGSLAARVETVDSLGNQTLLNLNLNDQLLVVSTSAVCPFRPQDQVHITLDPDHIRLFESGSHGTAL